MASNVLDRYRFEDPTVLFDLDNKIRNNPDDNWKRYTINSLEFNRPDVIYFKVYRDAALQGLWIVYAVCKIDDPFRDTAEIGKTYFFPPLEYVANELKKIERKIIKFRV